MLLRRSVLWVRRLSTEKDINFLLRQVHSDSGLRYGISNPSFCTPNNTTMQKLTEVEDCAVVHELDLGAKIRRADH